MAALLEAIHLKRKTVLDGKHFVYLDSDILTPTAQAPNASCALCIERGRQRR